VLCTDGDFNVGLTGTEELAKFVETRAKETNVYLTVLGFGRGNLNDAMLEQISGRGDGHYAYIDNEKEARRVLSHDLSGTLVAIAKDVKLQVEFNPAKVASYRLVGYENRVMAAEDFNNDAKDAGDIGAGHTVTALYEIVPVGVEAPAPAVDGLKYQQAAGSGPTAGKGEPGASATGGATVEGNAVEDDAARVELSADSQEPTAFSNELLTLKIRYKQPEGGASKKLEFPLEESDSDKSVSDADADFRWAAAVVEFGMLLRNSRHVGDGSFDAVLERARGAVGDDPQGYRAEFIDMVRRAKEVSGR
jgi:Ca-activated chloride channel family protein